MVYPTLPADADAVSIYEQGLSPYYDITWSVTYRVDNLPPDNEIGLCMFLQDEAQPLSGGGVGIDLGYSGLSADNPSYPASVGMLSAVIGIGLDSTGQFPLSVQWPDGTIRDGLSETERVFNSASIRGSYPNYPYLSGSNTEITDFDIVDTQKKTIRARLGNYGRTIYLDYKRNDDDSFTNILTKDVYIPFNETTRFRPGVSITKPISSNISPVSQVIVEAFHVEGLDENPTNAEFQFNPLTIYSQNTSINTTPPAVCPEILPPLPPLPPEVMPRPLEGFQKYCGDTLSGANNDTDITTAVYRISGGAGPVTITYNLSSPPLSSINTTLSTTSYEFETGVSQLSVNILSAYLNDFSLWNINEGSMVTFSNLNSAVSGEVLTVVGFNGYPDICTLWVDESAADGLSISASYCSVYLSAFTMVLTGDYSFTGIPVGQQPSPSNNELYKVVNRLDKPTPVRFDVEYDDQSIYDTGFVGSEEYSYGGIYRQEFINAINSGISVTGLSASQIAQDGYPLVIPTLSSSTIYQKESDSVRAQVTVYDILSSRDWTFSMSCPVSAESPSLCDPNHTVLCWTLDGVELATLNGSVNAGLFTGTWDNFGTPTAVTLTWNGSAWILNTNDGIYESEIISTDRCDPSGGVNVLLGRFRISIGNCGDPCDPDITEVCVTVTIGGVPGSETLTGDLSGGYIGDSGTTLTWDPVELEWVLDDGIYISNVGSGSFRRCNPAGSNYIDGAWTAVVTLGPC